MQQDPLKDLLSHRFMGPNQRTSDLRGLEPDFDFPGSGPYFENHCIKVKKKLEKFNIGQQGSPKIIV